MRVCARSSNVAPETYYKKCSESYSELRRVPLLKCELPVFVCHSGLIRPGKQVQATESASLCVCVCVLARYPHANCCG